MLSSKLPGARCIKLCRITSMCTYKDRNIHTQSLCQIYKDALTPDSVLQISVTVELGAIASFPQPQFTINGCRKALKHTFVINICAPPLFIRPVSEKNGKEKFNFTNFVASERLFNGAEQLSLCVAVDICSTRTTNSLHLCKPSTQ